ncbi:MAG: hypothetical protein CO128_01170 [Ignavibacteriales bacterium CG_4_9_14_3_um_filter_30_11]|nr:MAG: hypothetical protein CO128_01170 [Ignavibacteriales bacterium CG_4_9_14_3_um_filter_30_11]
MKLLIFNKNILKVKKMKKLLFVVLIMTGYLSAQNFVVKKVNGDVKAQIGTSEIWNAVNNNTELDKKTTIMTSKNSDIVLMFGNEKIKINNLSIVALKGIKKFSTDELLLALAMENLINIPDKKDNTINSSNTAVYGKEINGNTKTINDETNFGIMRLNGAKQLAENGYVESAIVEAMETYRKYPDTKPLSAYRIYFADLLVSKNLYEEALTEYNNIVELKLSDKEKIHTEVQMTFLKKKLLR